MIETDAGSVEAFRLETSIAQTFWIADEPHRALVRIDIGGISAVLSRVEKRGEKRLENRELGFGVTVPEDWFYYEANTDNASTSGGFNLVAPDMVSVQVNVQNKALLDRAERESTRAWADGRIRNAKLQFRDTSLRPAGLQDTEMAALPAVSFELEYPAAGRAVVSKSTLAMNETWAIEFNVSALDGDDAALHEQIEAIRESITIQ